MHRSDKDTPTSRQQKQWIQDPIQQYHNPISNACPKDMLDIQGAQEDDRTPRREG